MKKTLFLIAFIYYKSSLFAQSGLIPPDQTPSLPGFPSISQNTLFFSYDDSGNQIKRSFEIILIGSKSEEENYLVEIVDTKLKVYPNPSDGPVTISLPNNVSATEIILIDIRGSVLRRYSINNTQLNQEINISQFPIGVYILQILTKDGKMLTSKIIKS